MLHAPSLQRRALCRALIVAAFWIVSCSAGGGLFAQSQTRPERHPTRILARFHGATASAAASSLAPRTLAAQGLRVSRRVPSVPGLVVLDDAPVVQAAAAGPSTAAAVGPSLDQRISALRQSGLFAYVEPDYAVRPCTTPGDQALMDGRLWGLLNAGQDGGVTEIDIDAVAAWEITAGSPDVVVAVIDTGIDYTHVDLRDQMWRNPGEIAGNRIDDDGNGFVDDVFGVNAIDPAQPPMDDHNHGTHVAGTIAAAANNGHPHVGVAWRSRLMACKFIAPDGYGYTTDAITCIDYAARHGASIINASWGGVGYSQALMDSIAAAGHSGVLFVAAAGNSGIDLQSERAINYPHYPSGYDLESIMSVAALTRRGELAGFSNFGRFSVDIAAPGEEIFSSTALSGKYGYAVFRGTSMAAPHVAAVAALVRAHRPELNPSEVKALLLQVATPTPPLADKTVAGGRVNAYTALSSHEDGELDLTVTPKNSYSAVVGHPLVLQAYVTDLHEVVGATVTGLADGEIVTFRDDGVAPDEVAGDARHTATLVPLHGGGSLVIQARAEMPGRQPRTVEIALPRTSPPANDAFGAALTLTGSLLRVRASNVGASREPGEPNHADQPGGASLWWVWVAPADGRVDLSTHDTDIDTLMAVYTGDALGALELVAASDDLPTGSTLSAMTFNATAGASYHIAVDGWSGMSGPFTLELASPAPLTNDAFAQAQPLAGTEIVALGSTLGATFEPGETTPEGVAGGSVWHQWTSPADGVAIVLLDSSEVQHRCHVYLGDSLGSLEAQPTLYRSYNRYDNMVRFRAAAGQTYRISAAPETTPGGVFRLSLSFAPRPANDDFAGRSVVHGDDATVGCDTRGATAEPGEPELFPQSGISFSSASTWYSWTPTRRGTAWISVPKQQAATSALAAYTGDALQGLTRVAEGYQNAFIVHPLINGNHMMFPVEAGVPYAILATGIEATFQRFDLRIRLLDPPANSITPAILTGTETSIAASNLGATGPVSWIWTAPMTGSVIVTAETTEFVPTVSAFVRTAGSRWESVVYDGPGAQRRIGFTATAGREYLVSVSGVAAYRNSFSNTGPDGLHGTFRLGLTMGERPNDRYERAIVLTGARGSSSVSNRHAMPVPSTGFWVDAGAQSPLWWMWTAPETGVAVFSTAGCTLDSTMRVFDPGGVYTYATSYDAPFSNLASEIELPVRATYTYYILVDTATPGVVPLSVSLRGPPPNDAFAARSPIAPTETLIHGSNLLATAEAHEPGHGSVPATRSVWWTWTAPESGRYTITTAGSTFDTTLAVYAGDALDTLTTVASNDDASPGNAHSQLSLDMTAGVTYPIAVDGYRGERGDITLRITTDDRPRVAVAAPADPLGATEAFSLHADVAGAGPFTYQWYRNGSAIPGATGSTYAVPMAQRFHAGEYTVLVSGTSGVTVSEPVVVQLAPPTVSDALVSNISTRAICRGGDEVLIPGFVISGTGTRRMLMRAVGPELIPMGVAGSLGDPSMILLRAGRSGFAEVARNDDWADQGDAQAVFDAAAAVHAFPLETTSLSSAMVLDLPAGTYTILASGDAGDSGIALVELYDAEPQPADAQSARMVNLSNRGFAGAGADVMIPGFVVTGTRPKTFLLRAVGPGLSSLGVNGVLPNPQLTLFRHHENTATVVLSNDTWGENGDTIDIQTVASSVGAFPLPQGSADAALVVTLPPGVYTAHAGGVPGASGIVLVELYMVP